MIKKLIFYSITIILLIISCVLYFNDDKIVEIKKSNTVEIENLKDSEEVLESLQYLLNRNNLQDYSNVSKKNKSAFENMTLTNISNYNLQRGEERLFQTVRGKRIMNAYFTEYTTYYDVKFNLITEVDQYVDRYIYEGDIKTTVTDIHKTCSSFDIDMDVYLTKKKVYIKFDQFIVTNYKSVNNTKDIENKIQNLFSDFESTLYKGKWIDFTDNKDIAYEFLLANEFNQKFFDFVYQNIVDYNDGEKNFIKDHSQYALTKEKYMELLRLSQLGSIVDVPYLEDCIFGNLIVDLTNNDVNIDFLTKCSFDQTINLKDYYPEMYSEDDYKYIQFSCYEEDQMQITNINKTIINELDDDDIYDFEDVEFIFEKFEKQGK